MRMKCVLKKAQGIREPWIVEGKKTHISIGTRITYYFPKDDENETEIRSI